MSYHITPCPGPLSPAPTSPPSRPAPIDNHKPRQRTFTSGPSLTDLIDPSSRTPARRKHNSRRTGTGEGRNGQRSDVAHLAAARTPPPEAPATEPTRGPGQGRTSTLVPAQPRTPPPEASSRPSRPAAERPQARAQARPPPTRRAKQHRGPAASPGPTAAARRS